MKINKICILLFVIVVTFTNITYSQEVNKERLIVLTDMEADPDDVQSFIRLLLYANQIDIEGLIATTSVHQKERVAPETIHKILSAYEKVQPNLNKHEPGFPLREELSNKVSQGLPVFGMLGVGKGKDSDGSELIIRALEKNDDRPLWISVWGGANTLAQALWKIKETNPASKAKNLIKKLRVYTISDQDDSGIWMRKNFRDLFYIVSPGSYMTATWLGINGVFSGANNEVISNDWIAQNIQQGHGPLGAMYSDVAYGMEGDTPAWLMLINNGLNAPEHPDWGGWGGRYEFYKPAPITEKINPIFTGGTTYEPEVRPIWTNSNDTYTPYVSNTWGRAVKLDTTTYTGNQVTLWRWREDFQNDFAARMDWCTASYEEANHPPVARLNHPSEFTVKSGKKFKLGLAEKVIKPGDFFISND